MKAVKAKITDCWIEAGKTYWMQESDFMGHCYHIYASPCTTDSHMFNLFSEEKFNEEFKIA